ncbi:MAG: hypothetical protein AMQ22_02281 [Candidatus Methanofastidiosum methylothiophilum]|uniref:Uncharacterized protein n=1 Tax=Candidatus Methanofastidiosum methylothiophilum TaxID=1705564 RepID=A0A150II31_9EURY|nr:MAG: hypothetical protein AMQ22_02281 [Candidatus Methanofastidiosum methylthiophilus]
MSRFLNLQTNFRNSSAVKKEGGLSASGTIPEILLIAIGSDDERFITSEFPESWSSCPVNILTSVVFPAPLGPRRPKNSPSLTLRLIPLSAL